MLSAEKAYERRWWTLGVLCLSLVVIVIDNSILNVALPTIVRDLGASGSDLQWILDSYIIVFASLLLIAGALGDKYGRKGALTVGLILFGGFSGLAAFATSPEMLIAARALMGIGAAFIFPTTLSILTNTFHGRERATAIGVWAGVSGIGVALGPMLGGLLVEHFDWGAVFFVNIPICAAALVLGFFFIPTSRDPDNRPLDPLGAFLSIVTLVFLLYAIIQAPDDGLASRTDIVVSFGIGLLPARRLRAGGRPTPRSDDRRARVPQRAVLGRVGGAHAHVLRALRLAVPAHPVLPVRARLLAVRGRAPRPAGRRRHDGDVAQRAEAGVPLGHEVGRRDRIADDRGDRWCSTRRTRSCRRSSAAAWCGCFFGIGLGLTSAPATESIMGSLPPSRAGVGSAINDTTRQTGGALGVASSGACSSSSYHHFADKTKGLSAASSAALHDSVGRALDSPARCRRSRARR